MVDERAEARSRDLRIMTDDGAVLAVHDSGPQTAQRTVVPPVQAWPGCWQLSIWVPWVGSPVMQQ